MNPPNPHTSKTQALQAIAAERGIVSTSWESRYTFSGKEKESETGYSYFGARYYDSDLSVWLSVDPMADKYPSMSAYMYTAGNPVMLVDPDGRDWYLDNEGLPQYNKDIKSQADLDAKKIAGKYLFAEGWDSRDNLSGKNVKLNADGTRDYNAYATVEIKPDSRPDYGLPSSSENTSNNPNDSKGGFWVVGEGGGGFNQHAKKEINFDGKIEVPDDLFTQVFEWAYYGLINRKPATDDEKPVVWNANIPAFENSTTSPKNGDTIEIIRCYKKDSIERYEIKHNTQVNPTIIYKNEKK